MEDFERRVRDSFAQQQFMATLGASVSVSGKGNVEIEFPYHASLTQQNGFVHAGAITSILDSACGYAALSVAPPGCDVLSAELMNALRRNCALLAPRIAASIQIPIANRKETAAIPPSRSSQTRLKS